MTGLIILAAGSSSRLGTPKQNLVFQGTTLLQRTIATALATDCKKVIVVLGANAKLIEPTIADQSVQIIHNPDWQEGMASSIRIGIDTMQQSTPQLTSVILMLCDQPFADVSIINQLIKASTQNNLVASAYNGTLGPPALFGTAHFDELLLLQGNEGAKKLLLKYADEAVTVPFSLGVIDIDTLSDYERLDSQSNN
jgi:molybdenum cofactor cytidylyltransferase